MAGIAIVHDRHPEMLTLRAAIDGGDAIVTTGLVLQELLKALLCIRHELTLLTTDADLRLAARHCPLRVWSATR